MPLRIILKSTTRTLRQHNILTETIYINLNIRTFQLSQSSFTVIMMTFFVTSFHLHDGRRVFKGDGTKLVAVEVLQLVWEKRSSSLCPSACPSFHQVDCLCHVFAEYMMTPNFEVIYLDKWWERYSFEYRQTCPFLVLVSRTCCIFVFDINLHTIFLFP